MTLAATPLAPAVVEAAWDETACLRGLRVLLPERLARHHGRPGQVVKLHAASGEAYFALASAPHPSGRADLLVKRGGRVADEIVAAATPGASILTSPPFGEGFAVQEAHGRHVLLFAAGSGIAPIRSIIQHVLAHRSLFEGVVLFYGQRRGSDFAYRGEYLSWESAGIRVVLCPSGEDEAWPGVRGRVQEVAHAMGFAGSPPESTVAFACGMTAMVEDVKATLARAGVPPQSVHLNF